LSSLEPLKDQLLLLTGLQNTKQDRPMGDHAGGIARLAPIAPSSTRNKRWTARPSIRFVADQIGSKTKLKSIELSGEEGFSDGSCDSGYPCAIGNTSRSTGRHAAAQAVRHRRHFRSSVLGASRRVRRARPASKPMNRRIENGAVSNSLGSGVPAPSNAMWLPMAHG